jgi:hypothetical protein
VKVTRLVCDRCGDELRVERAQEHGLGLQLRYQPTGDPLDFLERLRGSTRRQELDLCPGCREDFAEWTGEGPRDLAGLVDTDDGSGVEPRAAGADEGGNTS